MCFFILVGYELPDFLIIIPFIFSVYDVTRRETFTNLSDIWAKEIDLYSTNQDCIKMLVGNKADKVLGGLQLQAFRLVLHFADCLHLAQVLLSI